MIQFWDLTINQCPTTLDETERLIILFTLIMNLQGYNMYNI